MRVVIRIVGLDALATRSIGCYTESTCFGASTWSTTPIRKSISPPRFGTNPVEAIFNGRRGRRRRSGDRVLASPRFGHTWLRSSSSSSPTPTSLSSGSVQYLGGSSSRRNFHQMHHSRENAEANTNFGQAFSILGYAIRDCSSSISDDRANWSLAWTSFRESKFSLPITCLRNPCC